MKKKILVVDDSALMRRVMCDIINSDKRYEVADTATNGLEAFDLLLLKSYDAVVLDINMPKMNGLQLLRKLQKFKIPAKVLVASTNASEGAKVTLDALELGALDFVHIPDNSSECKENAFSSKLLSILEVVSNAKLSGFADADREEEKKVKEKEQPDEISKSATKKKVVAIASSTGGPKALQTVISQLPGNLNVPVLIVQHMPKGFTESLAERLNALSGMEVTEAAEGMVLKPGCVYLAMGGKHMNVHTSKGGEAIIHYSDEPNREGVKPCANYMYESLANSPFDEVVCVVMTGMGCDGTEGINNLKTKKKLFVIAQNQESCVVYGMPKSVVNAGLANRVVPLEKIAHEIILNVGVK